MSIVKHLSHNIIKLRNAREWTQEDLSKKAELPRTTISNLESGSSNPSILTLEKVAKGFGVSVEEIFGKPKGMHKLVKANDVPVKIYHRNSVKQYKMLPSAILGMEIDKIELEKNARMIGNPHLKFTREFLICIKGIVQLNSEGLSHILEEGDVLEFPGDQPHSYFNRSKGKSICFSVVSLSY